MAMAKRQSGDDRRFSLSSQWRMRPGGQGFKNDLNCTLEHPSVWVFPFSKIDKSFRPFGEDAPCLAVGHGEGREAFTGSFFFRTPRVHCEHSP